MKKRKGLAFLLTAIIVCSPIYSGVQTAQAGHATTSYSGYYRQDAGVNYEKSNGYLIRNGKTDYSIVVPSKEDNTAEMYAANELATYIQEMYNIKMIIETDEHKTFNASDRVISVGKTVYLEGADLKGIDYSQLKTGGFITKSVGNTYLLDSGSKNGLLYAAYNFLEVFFGLEFLTNTDTYYPEATDVIAYEADILDIPTFGTRDYYSASSNNGPKQSSKFRINSSMWNDVDWLDSNYYYGYYYDYNGQRKSINKVGHTTYAWLATDAYINGYVPTPTYRSTENGANTPWEYGYYGQHEEWYAYIPGDPGENADKRVQCEICYSNGLDDDGNWKRQASDTPLEEMNVLTKMIEICKNMILQEDNKSAQALMLGHGDARGKCLCDRCVALEQKFGGYGGLTVVWTNELIKEVLAWMEENNIQTEHEIRFTIFAYNKSLDAPVKAVNGNWVPVSDKVVCHPRINIQVAYFGCGYHSLTDDSCDVSKAKYEIFKQWKEIASAFEIWDYACNFMDFVWPLSTWKTWMDNYKFYQEINARRVLTQGTPGCRNYYEHHLKQWLSMKMMWNPNRNVNDMIEDYNNKFFGEKYAKYANGYISMLENHYAKLDTREMGFHASTGNDYGYKDVNNWPKDLLEGLINFLQRGIDEASVDPNLSELEREKTVERLTGLIIAPQHIMMKGGYISETLELNQFAKKFFANVELLDLGSMREGGGYANSYDAWRDSFDLD